MLGKITALMIVGFAALVSASDFSISEQLKNKITHGDRVYVEPTDADYQI